MAEEPQQQSIQARIAALNVGHVGRAPITALQNKRPVPEPPLKRANTATVPTSGTSSQEIGNQPASYNEKAVLPPPEGIVRTGQVNGSIPARAPPPRAPPRTSSTVSRPSPALPPRKPSDQLTRRGSQESISSTISSISAMSTGTTATSNSARGPSMDSGRVRAPVYDPSTLPPLPPKRSQTEKETASRTPLQGRQPSVANIISTVKSSARPPALPERKDSSMKPAEPPRRLPPTTIPPVKPRSVPSTPNPQNLPTPEASPNPSPPPIPSTTKPDLAALMATKPKMPAISTRPVPNPTAAGGGSCLVCRDFSAVDQHAQQFPRHQARSLQSLAQQLCAPFPSLTDKARAIFTWCHYNIAYDVVAFFGKNVKPSTPESTLATGLGVCQGYACIFADLATHAGLECVVVGGHGKGFGHTPLRPGESPPPPNPTGHAWNAVRIDGGVWKLTDPCWGAGVVQGAGKPYKPLFNPAQFTSSNEEFGWRHFPSNSAHFFRTDGRASISWDEYMRGPNPTGAEPPSAFCLVGREGFKESTLLPAGKQVSADPRAHPGGMVRFQLERVCAHWDPVRNGEGKDYLYCINVKRADGRGNAYFPFDTNGTFFWCDVPVANLGERGGQIMCVAITKLNDLECRGMTRAQYDRAMNGNGRSMSWGGVAAWELT